MSRLEKIDPEGFALIVALALMSFILLLLLSLSTLLKVELSSSAERTSLTVARENALLGLQQAIGVLQSETGPDQRVTAQGRLLGPTNSYAPLTPHESDDLWTGVWSTENYDPETPHAKTFQRWLLSLPETDATELSSIESQISERSPPLKTTINEFGNEIETTAALVDIDGPDSRDHFAWWIGDEGVKANLLRTIPEDFYDFEVRRAIGSMMTTPRIALEAFDPSFSQLLEDLDESVVAKLARTETETQLELLDTPGSDLFESMSLENRRDYSLFSYGVLSDTQTGGLRRDLSLAFSASDADWNAMPEFVQGGEQANQHTTTGGETVRYVYDFGSDGPGVGALSNEDRVRGPTWELFKNYYNLYKDVQGNLSAPSLKSQGAFPRSADWINSNARRSGLSMLSDEDVLADADFTFARNTSMGIHPVLTRLRLFVSYSIEPQSATELPAEWQNSTGVSGDHYKLNLHLDPVISIWNPYSVTLELTGMVVEVFGGKYFIDFDFESIWDGDSARGYGGNNKFEDFLERHFGDATVSRNQTPTFFSFVLSDQGVTAAGQPDFSTPITLKPGEVAVFTPDPLISGDLDRTTYLKRGYSPTDFEDRRASLNDVFEFSGLTDPSFRIASDGKFRLKSRAQNNGVYVRVALIEDTAAPTTISAANPAIQHLRLDTKNDAVGRNLADEWLPDEDGVLASDFADGDKHPVFYQDLFLKPESEDLSPFPIISQANPRALGAFMPYSGYEGRMAPNWQVRIGPLFNWGEGLAGVTPSGRGFWGEGIEGGLVDQTVLYEVPVLPPLSLAGFQHAENALMAWQPAYSVAHSNANPWIPRSETTSKIPIDATGDFLTHVDTQWWSNHQFWDQNFLSSLDPALSSVSGNHEELITNVSDGTESVPNAAFVPISGFSDGLLDSSGALRDEAYRQSAEHLLLQGSFNVNSVSAKAWESLLRANNGIQPAYVDENGVIQEAAAALNPASRLALPSGQANQPWHGYLSLSDEQVSLLAELIVEEVKIRGPFVSLGDFINRRLDEGESGMRGTIGAAINKLIKANEGLSLVENVFTNFYSDADKNALPFDDNPDYFFPENLSNWMAADTVGYPTQADILSSLGSVLSARSDTFVIRAYGEHTVSPNTADKTRAWCEAVLQRIPAKVDNSDPSDNADGFGRKYILTHFRWLNENEI